jgi:hypothetical protein
MTSDATHIAGWIMLAASLMLWLGWVLLPVKLGTFFAPGDFARIDRVLHRWIWLFRVYLFGYVVSTMAFVAVGATVEGAVARCATWPAIAVACAGLIVSALAAAFYYHFGAWGAIDMRTKSTQELARFVDSLRVSTEYVTCLVRFGRVFFGFGQLALALGLLVTGLWPQWLALSAALLGVAAMALTMALPDNLEFYQPVFHLNALWLAAIGIVLLGLAA